MKPARVRLAARIAAIEAFREESERQRLAVARHAATAADAAAARAEQTWLEVEATRSAAIFEHGDVSRYLILGGFASRAVLLHDDATHEAAEAHAAAEAQSGTWAVAKARSDATSDRATRRAVDEMAHTEKREEAERMELWLARRSRSA